jgi:hypothetical protein
LALAAGEFVRITLGNVSRLQADAVQQITRPRHRSIARQAVHLRAEGNAVFDGQARASDA